MAPYSYGQTLVRVDGVNLAFGDNVVLRDVRVEIKDVIRPGSVTGQVVGFLGPSGIGKTQFSRILAGLKQPDSGTVLIGPNGGQAVRAGSVGYVAQNYVLFEHRTVMGNLLIAGRQGGMTKKDAGDKAMAYLERFGLAERASYYPMQLSGGQRQRVAIIRQLMCSEHFLIMDEPFSGLDVIQLQNVRELISEVSRVHEFNTIIVITHDVTAAAMISDTLWLMGRDRTSDGQIVPGARIHTVYDLAAMGMAWHEDIDQDPRFRELVYQIKKQFREM